MENAIERLVVSTFHDAITESDVRKMLLPNAAKEVQTERMEERRVSLPERLNQVEKEILEDCFRTHKTTRAIAGALGIDQSTVVKKLKKYGIK